MGAINAILRSKQRLASVVLDWRAVLKLNGCQSDQNLIAALRAHVITNGGNIVLVGRRQLAEYMSSHLQDLNVSLLVDDYHIGVPASFVTKIRESSASFANAVVFICETDRVNGDAIHEALRDTKAVDPDFFPQTVLAHVPDDAWCDTYDHIYPIDVPKLSLESGLNAVILDVPARSLAQLPIGFSYVYKALKGADLQFQAVDVDILAYHWYHNRRCRNSWPTIIDGDHIHPDDPWQAASYLFWTSPDTLKYFQEIIDEIVEAIVGANPKILGFSLHQTSHCFIKEIVDRVKPQLPDTIVVVGGMSCYQSRVAREVFPEADYVIVGEADLVVGPLFEALTRGERPFNLPGILSHLDTEDHTFTASPLPHNLDQIGRPDYGFTDLDLYRNWNDYRLMPIVGSRGCGWSRCTFCAERFNWRARTPELVAEEIEYYTQHGFKDFVFNESDFNSNHEFVIRLCEDLIRRKLDINLTAQLRISKKSDLAYFQLMRDAGFTCLRFGVDGLTENTLKLQRKGYTQETVRRNLADCKTVGIYTEINVVIGVPGETEEDIDESIEFLLELKPVIGRVAFLNPLMLFVASVYYNNPEEFNIKFRQPQEELYKTYVVSLPDNSWYSEEPYIDHEIRNERFFRIVDKLLEYDVPMGDFAKFTAQHRKDKGDDPHLVASETHSKLRSGPDEESASVESDAPVPVTTEHAQTLTELTEPTKASVREKDGEFYRCTPLGEEKLDTAPYSDVPVLLSSYKGFNLVVVQDKIYAAPIALGQMDLSNEEGQQHPHVIAGDTESEVMGYIDLVERFSGGSSVTSTPDLIGPHKNYNIVSFGGLFYAVPLSFGALDLHNHVERQRDGILLSETEDGVRQLIDRMVIAA